MIAAVLFTEAFAKPLDPPDHAPDFKDFGTGTCESNGCKTIDGAEMCNTARAQLGLKGTANCDGVVCVGASPSKYLVPGCYKQAGTPGTAIFNTLETVFTCGHNRRNCICNCKIEPAAPANAGCAKGTVGATCSPCVANTYKSTADDAPCTKCPSNTGTGKDVGSTKLEDCLADAGFTGDGSNVAACKAGTFKVEGHSKTHCNHCPAGKYQSKTGSSSCEACPQVKPDSSAGSGALTLCTGPTAATPEQPDGAHHYSIHNDKNAFKLHGGTEIDAVAVEATEAECRDRCDADTACDCVSHWGTRCWKRSNCDASEFKADLGFKVMVKDSKVQGAHRYNTYDSKNAFTGAGATDMDVVPEEGFTEVMCRARCDSDAECQCVSFEADTGKCWMRMLCVPSGFKTDAGFAVMVKGKANPGAAPIVKDPLPARDGAAPIVAPIVAPAIVDLVFKPAAGEGAAKVVAPKDALVHAVM